MVAVAHDVCGSARCGCDARWPTARGVGAGIAQWGGSCGGSRRTRKVGRGGSVRARQCMGAARVAQPGMIVHLVVVARCIRCNEVHQTTSSVNASGSRDCGDDNMGTVRTDGGDTTIPSRVCLMCRAGAVGRRRWCFAHAVAATVIGPTVR